MAVVVKWEASAPSNIALIKYMGKRSFSPSSIDTANMNVAVNPSLSWTLDHLRSFVQLELLSSDESQSDAWQPHPQWPLEMSELGQQKYLAHLQRVKKIFSAENYFFKIRSGNNFPADCGIASSASSFAALTLVAAQALSQLTKQPLPSMETLANLSRQGSGSSCRSFFSGFVVWEECSVRQLPTSTKIYHQVVIVSGDKKQVSSSQAHQRVQSSLLMNQREERVQVRYALLCEQLLSNTPDWKKMYELTWSEFWDMHALFETSDPAFGYMTSNSLEILNNVREYWQQKQQGPLVTMDAGPNVHLLWRQDQKLMAQEFAQKNPQWKWIEVGQ
jgi:diphosphomevalonate decarboxylase